LDPRLPRPAAEELLAALRPTRVVGPDGAITRLSEGRGVDEGDAAVIATSGSTGVPRGVILTHDALAASARATTERLGVDPARHRWLCCLPVAHVGGFSVLTRSLLTATPVTVLPRFDAETVTDIGRRGEATHVSLVATALARVAPSLFTTILLGGAAPPEGLPDNVVTTYGLTETGSGVVYDGMPLRGVEVALVPRDGGAGGGVVAGGEGTGGEGTPGEILLRGPMLLRAYRDGTDPTVAGPDGRGGWLPTGDAGHLGADGRLMVDGRIADVIVTGAEKVWPARVEQVLGTHPAVAEVAVWKRPDAEWGERVVAWVVPADPAHPPGLAELRDHVAVTLPRWAAPRELVVVPALARTGSGKVRRRSLG
jgi:O-succinylbenzoic acid--CoA ligase